MPEPEVPIGETLMGACGSALIAGGGVGWQAAAMMNPRERMRRAVTHQVTDFCPYLFDIPEALHARLVAFTGDPGYARGLVAHAMGVGPRYPETNVRLDATHYRDAYGVVWEEATPGEIGMVREPVLREATLAGYQFPETDIPGLWDGTQAQLDAHPERYSVWSLGFSLFERAWALRGLEPFLMDMVDEPDFAHALLDRICEVNLALIEQARAWPIDCIRFGDDWGAQQGLIMGPARWRTFIKPRFARMVAAVRQQGKHALLHSDGDIRAIIPDLVEVGLTILNPLQSDVMDVYEIKRTFGKDLAFLGGLSVQHVLPEGAPADVRREVETLIRELGRGGGYVCCPTHTLGPDIPVENILAVIECLTAR